MRSCLTLLLSCILLSLSAQMVISPGDTLYGNEWVETEATYLRIPVTEAAWYQLTAEDLAVAGFDLSTPSDQWALFHRGQPVPLQRNENGLFFYGRPNDGSLDRHLYEFPDRDQLNPAHSMFNDTAAYFLSTSRAEGSRLISNVENNPSTEWPEATSLRRSVKSVFGNFPQKRIERFSGVSLYYSHFDQCEGYGSRRENDLLSFNGTTVTTAQLPLPGHTGQGTVDVNLRFGLGFDGHRQELRLNGELLRTFDRSPWQVVAYDSSLQVSGDQLELELTGTAGDRDKASLAYFSATYSTDTDLSSGEAWSAVAAAGPAQRLTFTGLAPGQEIELCDLNNDYCLRTITNTEGNATFGLPASGEERDLYLRRAEDVLRPVDLSVFDPTIVPEADYDYLILSSERLNAGGAVDRYANYRRSPAGGGYRVQIAYIESLYDQFGYGLTNSPLAQRNFIFQQTSRFPSLRFLMIIGKGIEGRSNRNPTQRANNRAVDFVPPFGYPATDLLMSALPGQIAHRLATGRIAVHNEEEIDVYLDKIEEMDAQVNLPQTVAARAWTKQFMQLGGGTTPFERASIRSNLENMEDILLDSDMAAASRGYYKTSSDPTETAGTNEIFRRINDGLLTITFSGHSSPDVFDFNIDLPENYDNQGRLATFFSLGCYSGNMFRPSHGVGERFLLLPDRGAIAFGASRGLGVTNALRRIGAYLYEDIGNRPSGKSLGEIIQSVATRYVGDFSITHRSLIEQFSLQGDPAYHLQSSPGPDLVVDPASVRFASGAISLQADSFAVEFTLHNLGTVPDTDTVWIQVDQELPEGEIREHGRFPVPLRGYATPVQLTLSNQGSSSVGFNRLRVEVDPRGRIDELPNPAAEFNNELRAADGRAGIPFFVVANTAYPLYPYNYALTGPGPDGNMTLTAATSDPLSSERPYLLQVDTDPDFTNPLDQTTMIQIGGRINWQPSVSWTDSTVYYWRVSPDSSATDGAGYVWLNSSFTYLEDGTTGFGQGDVGQFAEGKLAQLKILPDGEIVPTADTLEIQLDNEAWYLPSNGAGYLYSGAGIYSWEMRPWLVFGTGGVAVSVYEGYSGLPWLNNGSVIQEEYGTPHNRPRDEFWFWKADSLNSRANLLEFLDEVVPEESVVLLWTVIRRNNNTFYADRWARDSLSLGRNLFSYLEEQGAELVRGLEEGPNLPYVFFYRKGVGPLAEALADSPTDQVSVKYQLPARDASGTLLGRAVGPSFNWESLSWENKGTIEEADEVQLVLYGGINRTTPDSLLTLDQPGEYELTIDPEQYPYLSYEWRVSDQRRKTLLQLDHVQIRGTFFPDLLFDANSFYVSSPDTIQTGEDLRFEIALANAGAVPSAETVVVAKWFNAENVLLDSARQNLSEISPGDTVRVGFLLPTQDQRSVSRITLSINPDRTLREHDYTNNNLQRDFFLDRDVIAPLLDVTYDGRRINDGELVSAAPTILLELRDENPFLPLIQRDAVRIELINPEGQSQLFTADHPAVNFIPANAEQENVARYELRPELLLDGRYTLLVSGRDESENSAGKIGYEGSFEVIRNQSITRVVNYPNPFSDRTYFVYELTGTTALLDYRLDIMTVSGEVVHSLGPAELGPLEVGRHQTQGSWNGTDRYGDRLANGVYLYRFVSRQENSSEAVEQRDSALDPFFKNDMGKLVILR